MVTEDIVIRIRAIDEATRVLSKVAGSVRKISAVAPQLAKGVDKLTIIRTFKPVAADATILSGKLANLGISAQVAGVSIKKFNKALMENGIQFIQGIGFMDKFTGKLVNTSDATRRASVQAKRFKFEWLSVMFAGMALSRVFGGLVRTQLELFGVTSMLSSAWTLVLLPIMELITPILFKMLEFFMNIPEPLKLLVGGFVLFAAVLGIILTVVGQVMLAVGGFVLLGFTVAGVTAFVLAFSAVLIGIILIVKGIFDIFKGKFEGIGLIIMGVGAILLLFIGWWALIPIAVGLVVYLIIKHWDKIKAFFGKVWDAIKTIFKKSWKWILGLLFPPAGIVILFIKYWDPIKAFFSKIWTKIKDIFWSAAKFIISIPGKIFNAFKGLGKMIKDAITNILPNWMIKLLKGFSGSMGKLKGFVGSFQTGGIVPETGLALVHKGERVIPRSEVNKGNTNNVVFAPVTNIEAVITSDVDIDRLAEEINRRLAPQFERAVGRGTI